VEVDKGLRALFTQPKGPRPYPADAIAEAEMTVAEKKHTAALMRINHTGEVCAQALYRGQLCMANDPDTSAFLQHACKEEEEHLTWTARRVAELGGRLSILNPAWYAMSFTIGVLTAAVSDSVSLGFVEETERQVEQHLNSHLQSIPTHDGRTRLILQQMRDDEIEHGATAKKTGASALPDWMIKMMRLQARVMTALTYHC